MLPTVAQRSISTMSEVEMASANRAVPMGTSIATPEPSEMSRITTAMARPMSSACSEMAEVGASNASTTAPPNWVSTPAVSAGATADCIWRTMSFGSSVTGSANCTETYTTVWSDEMLPAVGEPEANGLTMGDTPEMAPRFLNDCSMAAWGAASVTLAPSLVRNTAMAEPPVAAGNCCSSRSMARWASVPGMAKLSRVVPPSRLASVPSTTATSTQAMRTHR